MAYEVHSANCLSRHSSKTPPRSTMNLKSPLRPDMKDRSRLRAGYKAEMMSKWPFDKMRTKRDRRNILRIDAGDIKFWSMRKSKSQTRSSKSSRKNDLYIRIICACKLQPQIHWSLARYQRRTGVSRKYIFSNVSLVRNEMGY